MADVRNLHWILSSRHFVFIYLISISLHIDHRFSISWTQQILLNIDLIIQIQSFVGDFIQFLESDNFIQFLESDNFIQFLGSDNFIQFLESNNFIQFLETDNFIQFLEWRIVGI